MELRVENFSVTSSGRNGCPLVDCCLTARPGELVGIVGPSGCGKSTLTKYVVQILQPKNGTGVCEWRHFGSPSEITPTTRGRILSPHEVRKIVKFVPARDFLPQEISVGECLSGQLAMRTGRTSKDTVKEVAELFGLQKILDRKIGERTISGISTGQRRRLALAMEYVDHPKAIVIDEPTSGIDSKAAITIVHLLKSLAKNEAATVVCVLHQPGMTLFSLFDRIAVMSAGRTLYMGSPSQCVSFFSPARYLALIKGPPYVNVDASMRGSCGSPLYSKTPDASDRENESAAQRRGRYSSAAEDTREIIPNSRVEDKMDERPTQLAPLELIFCFALDFQDNISRNGITYQDYCALRRVEQGYSAGTQEAVPLQPAHAETSMDDPVTRGRTKPEHETVNYKQGWFKQLGVLIVRHLRTRFRERGFLVSAAAVFVLMTLVVGCVYRDLPTKAISSVFVPVAPEIPLLDSRFPDYPNGTEWPGSARIRALGDTISGRRATSIPPSWTTFLRQLFSAALFGFDREGEGLGSNIIMDGFDGNGSKLAVPQWIVDGIPTFIPCMHNYLGLQETYPPYSVRPVDKNGQRDEDTTLGEPGFHAPTDAYDVVEQALQLYQVVDHVVSNYDWWEFVRCFQNYPSVLLNWLCVLILYPEVSDNALSCLGLPKASAGLVDSSTTLEGNPSGKILDAMTLVAKLSGALPSLSEFHHESSGPDDVGRIFSDEIQSASESYLNNFSGIYSPVTPRDRLDGSPAVNLGSQMHSLLASCGGVSGATLPCLLAGAAESHPNVIHEIREWQDLEGVDQQVSVLSTGSIREVLADSWAKFKKQMPVQHPLVYHAAALIFPQDQHAASETLKNLSDDFLSIADKFTSECQIPVCEIFVVVPTVVAGLFNDIIDIFWAALNKCGFIFVLSASAACWGLECALEFPKEREIANKDILNHTYSRLHFALAKLSVDAIAQLVPVICYGIIVLLLAGIHGGSAAVFFKLLVALVLTCLSASGMAAFCSALSRSKSVALGSSAVALTVCLLLSGFLIRGSRDAEWYRVLSPLSMFHYGYAALLIEAVPEGSTGFLSRWFVLDLFGGVRQGEIGWSYGYSILFLGIQCLCYRALAIIAMLAFYKKVGLKNA